MYGYAIYSQRLPKGRTECATLKCKDTISYIYYVNSQMCEYRNKGRYKGCVKGFGTKRINFPIFEGRGDPDEYFDWEFENIF